MEKEIRNHKGKKLHADQVRDIRQRYNLGGETIARIARAYEVHWNTVWRIVHHLSWSGLK